MLLLLFIAALLGCARGSSSQSTFDMIGRLEFTSRCYEQGGANFFSSLFLNCRLWWARGASSRGSGVSGALYTVFGVRRRGRVFDWGAGGKSEELYHLNQDGVRTRLFVEGLLHAPTPGMVRVMGTVDASGRHVVTGWSARSSAGTRRRRDLQQADIDNPNVVLIRVSMPAKQAVCPEAELVDIMWRGTSNARDFWAEMTAGRVRFAPDHDSDGRHDVLSVDLATAPAQCEDIWPAVTQRVRESYSSVDLTRWTRHVMVLPRDYTACGFAGASVGCPPGDECLVWLTHCADFPDSIIHEVRRDERVFLRVFFLSIYLFLLPRCSSVTRWDCVTAPRCTHRMRAVSTTMKTARRSWATRTLTSRDVGSMLCTD